MTCQPPPGPDYPSPPAPGTQDIRPPRYVYWYALALGCATAAVLVATEKHAHHAAVLTAAALAAMTVSAGLALRGRLKAAATATAAELRGGDALTRLFTVLAALAILALLQARYGIITDLAQDLANLILPGSSG